MSTIGAQATTLRIDAIGTPPTKGNLGVNSLSIPLQFDTSDDPFTALQEGILLSFDFGQAVINGSQYNLTSCGLNFENGSAAIMIGFPSDWAFARVILPDQITVILFLP